MPKTITLTPAQDLADKYVEWAAQSLMAAHRLEAKGGNAERLHTISRQAALKAKLLLA